MNGINFLKTFLILIFINLYAKEVFISFQYKVDNYKLAFFNFNCSEAMTQKKGDKKLLFTFFCGADNELKCCYLHKDLIVSKLLEDKIIITSSDSLRNNSLNNSSKLTYLPGRFDIIINNGVVYFYKKGD
jgi:hypothetical protein